MSFSAVSIKDLIPVLQVAIGPVILISGIGLLLLTLSNRFGRVVDRSRLLSRELREASEAERQGLGRQVEILYRRARLIRLSIAMAAVSVLLASVLIMTLFFTALFHLEVGSAIIVIFASCLACLVASLAAFITEINQSLAALKTELGYPGR